MILSTPFGTGLGTTALALAVAAAAAYAATALPARAARWTAAALVAGWLLHGVVLAIDVGGVGRPPGHGPRLGFGPMLSLTIWLVVAIHALESRFAPPGPVRRTLPWVAAAAVLLAWAFPGETRPAGGAHPLAALHWTFGVAAYALFGAAVLHGLMLAAGERALRRRSAPDEAGAVIDGAPLMGMPLLRLERLTFRFVEAGFVVLSAVLLLGAWSAARWRWDHKTVFSLLAWGVFALLLVGRRTRGWRGRRALRFLNAGAALLLLAYVGSRFVFEVLLGRPA